MQQQILLYLSLLFLATACQEKATNSEFIVSSDIDRFWQAYDQIQETPDSLDQLDILNRVFIDPASVGQQALFELRNYTPEEYLENIQRYPAFYNSLRDQYEQEAAISEVLQHSLQAFQKLYPKMRDAKVYYGIGNFRTNGTTLDTMVLLGTEMAFSDSSLNTSEFPPELQYFKDYMQRNPIKNTDFLAAHEFVHTQQKEAIGSNLLAIALREGSAEFIAELCTGQESQEPAIAYGKENQEAVFDAFQKEMFNFGVGYWVWNSLPNPFEQRDLGYYIGYALSQHYYEQSPDKEAAIARLIELDYSNPDSVIQFVDQLQFFDQPMAQLKSIYEVARPQVASVTREDNLFTVQFSHPMDTRFRGFDFGPLGEDQVLLIKEFIGFSDDAQTMQFTAEIKPGQVQQLLLTQTFRSNDGLELQPYLLEIN